MEQRFFLFQMSLLKSLSNLGLYKILKVAVEEQYWQYTPVELAYIAGIKESKKDFFFKELAALQGSDLAIKKQFYRDKFLTFLDKEYPDDLREIYNPPVILYYQGELDLLQKKSLAVIGSRNYSIYGKRMVEQLLPELIEKKWTIVSGLARGIDTIAHRTAIRHHGRTIGVIGSGIDVIYPKENRYLQEYISENNLLLSEYPCSTLPLSYHFPQRNRIIAGVTAGTCIIEAKERSGTLITANLALENGREVFAVPGDILTGRSDGCHLLIQQGAKCVWKAEHIIEEFPYLVK